MKTSPERPRPAAVAAVRTAAKAALRAYGVVTSPVRGLPDFIVIGGKRCGTTSLYRNLATHPLVAPLFPRAQQIKGTHFFDTNYHRGVSWYRSHFPTHLRRAAEESEGPGRVVGEACPYYLFHPHAPRRTYELVPDAKLIVLLRDPVARAYSHYRERVRHGVEKLTFEEALAREPERLAGEEERMISDDAYYSFAHEHFSYVGQGEYVRALERWLRLFPRELFLFVVSEDLFGHPEATYARVTGFLGLPPLTTASFERFNFHAGPSIEPDTRRALAERFAPHNRRLTELTGVDTSAWA